MIIFYFDNDLHCCHRDGPSRQCCFWPGAQAAVLMKYLHICSWISTLDSRCPYLAKMLIWLMSTGSALTNSGAKLNQLLILAKKVQNISNIYAFIHEFICRTSCRLGSLGVCNLAIHLYKWSCYWWDTKQVYEATPQDIFHSDAWAGQAPLTQAGWNY